MEVLGSVGNACLSYLVFELWLCKVNEKTKFCPAPVLKSTVLSSFEWKFWTGKKDKGEDGGILRSLHE